jgi:heterodisulfide reductase subunit B
MKYLYYPGCSLEGSAREYNASTLALMKAVGASIEEIPDWTCCGASAAHATSHLLSYVLPAVNLAKAENMESSADLMVPCSACYLNLKKVEIKTQKNVGLLRTINDVLAVEGFRYRSRVRVRHLLDILANDVGEKTIKARLKKSLKDLKIAPYYGCQCLRPYSVFDDPERPRSMEPLIKATNAGVFPWRMSARCCGAALLATQKASGLKLVAAILEDARGADAIATVCPMCQMNLEAYQKAASNLIGQDLSISVLYLSQVLGLALGISPQDLKLHMNLAIHDDFKNKLNTLGLEV